MLKIEHGCIFLRRTGDELEGVALLTRQLENADDSIEFFIRRFRLGDILCRAWCSLCCHRFLLFFLHRFNNSLSHIIIDVCRGFQFLLTRNRQYRPDRAERGSKKRTKKRALFRRQVNDLCGIYCVNLTKR